MFFKFCIKKDKIYYLNIILLFRSRSQEPGAGAGAGFENCLEPDPENQKKTGSGNTELNS